MRILVLGAGAVGGYFGGRLAEAGADVTFLVRPGRAARLHKSGLVIASPLGDARIDPQLITAEDETAPPFDLVIIACKAYGLVGAIEAITPFLHARTAVLPLLNGMAHLDVLTEAFGAERVLGGTCHIGAALDEEGRILHLTPLQSMTYGELDGSLSERVRAFDAVAQEASFETVLSDNIRQAMWDKWVFLATLAAGTCLMRASVGQILACEGGEALMRELLEECASVAEAEGFRPDEAMLDKTRAFVTDPESKMTSSLLRDIRAGNPIEGEHILGDLRRRAERHGVDAPLLDLARCHVQAYERVMAEAEAE
jgi:2-dehydropantoate 2-reductase